MLICRKIRAFCIILTILFFVAHPALAQLQFIENKGQWNKAVDFKSDFKTGSFYLQKQGFTVLLHNEKDLELLSEGLHGDDKPNLKARTSVYTPPSKKITVHSHSYTVNFLGASAHVQAVADKGLPTYNNYFIGNDKSKWQSNCKIFQGITYKNMYPNIDIRYYTDQGTLKYDFIVHPGGNVNDITLQYEGVDKLAIKNKELVISTSVGEVKELYPYTYQVQDKGRQTLDCKYVLKNNIIKFKVKDYLPDATIIIDPTLIFCSFAGSTSDNWGYTATPGPDGSFFAGGISFGDGYPASLGAFDQTYNGGLQEDNIGPYDIAIIKLSADGSTRLYATYLGGSGNEQPHSMICDAQGNLIVAGRSNSGDYPKLLQQGPGGGYDIVVTKFNASGTALLGSVKIGGTGDDGVNIRSKYAQVSSTQNDGAYDTRRNYGDDARSEVILDANNNILLASCTQSANFPTTVGVLQNSFAGGGSEIQQDGVILKFSPNLGSIIFSTFFGGTGNDACFVLSINPLTGNLYVAGATTSNDLPGNTSGVLLSSYQGGASDGFVTQIKPDGSAIIKTTYIGTSGNDLVYGIQFDKFGFPYIMGTTTGIWTAKNAAFSNGGGKQFIGKLQPDLSDYIYTTMFGTGAASPNISPTAFLVDRCQNVYVSGWGGSFNVAKGYPSAGTTGLVVTNDAIQSTTDGNDFYFFVLEKDATKQLFGSFFGQRGGFNDHVDGGTSRFDANGIIYEAICANCNNGQLGGFFPTTPGVWASTNRSVGCSEAALKIEMNFSGVGASVKATINGVVDTIGCVPLTISFTDTLAKGKRYIWDFGDKTPTVTTIAPNNSTQHIYTQVGSYRLMLVSIDSTTCNISDTAYVTVRVGNNLVVPRFVPQKQPPCTNFTFNFKNTTTATRPVYTNQTFTWDFGDGSPRQTEGFYTVPHKYASEGRYKVTLAVNDSIFCNSPDSFSLEIRLAINVTAKIDAPKNVCVGIPVSFGNNSTAGTEFTWNFGDGSAPSKDVLPIHVYAQPGDYTVTLIATDTSTCNKTDTAIFKIKALAIPVAGFSFSPAEPEENKPVFFTSFSSGASRLIWNFGDGEFSEQANPSHQFNATGTFNVCLIAINEGGCSDTICKPVKAKIKPLLDVPNAFTPGRFGINGIIKVTGFGIGKMDWKIYNRWGQVVFSSASKLSGWDGTFKGALQPVDVYTYTLAVEFTDGKKVTKTGDITLLR